jgi:hypothetical protein
MKILLTTLLVLVSPGASDMHSLEASVPDKIGTFTAIGTMREIQTPFAAARRQYVDGKRFLTVFVYDGASDAPLLTGFRELIKITPTENSPERMRKKVTLGKYPGLARWEKATNSSQVEVLVEIVLL